MKEIKREVLLPISKEKMWDLLFNDNYVYRYMGCHLRIRDNNRMEYYMEKDNSEIVLSVGVIEERVAEEYLLVKTYNPTRDYDQDYALDVEYNLEQEDKMTKLTIIQRGFESLPDGDVVYQENINGWDMVVDNLRKMF
jgi:uncharacterized protein YndB with AHSA1/START domain